MLYEECSDSDSGRVLDSRSRGCEFEPYRRRCVVSVSKTLYPLLGAGSTQEGLSQHDLKIVDWDIKDNKKSKTHSSTDHLYSHWFNSVI